MFSNRRAKVRDSRHLELRQDDDMAVLRILGIVGAVVLVGGWLAVESRGCRPPPDEVFIANALDRYSEDFSAGRTRVRVDRDGGSFEIDVVPYRDVDELRALNPDCCTVFIGPAYYMPRSWVIRYDIYAEVYIEFRSKLPTESGFVLSPPEETRKVSFWMTSCGTVSAYDRVKNG